MRQRITVADAKAARIPNVLNIPASDPRFLAFLNEAIERLIEMNRKWVGTVQKYRVCMSNGCITWPRQVETVEAVAVCDWPIRIRNHWYEFVEHGFGLRKETDGCATDMYDRGSVCSFEDIRGTDKKIKAYCDISTDADHPILLQGYNEDGNWIQTPDGNGGWTDGEIVYPSATGTLSTYKFTALTGVQKPVTAGVIRLYEYNTTDATQRAMALYEPDETRPTYRRSLIAGLSGHSSCTGATTGCSTKTVTVLAKMAFMPVYKDTDWLLIQSLSALRNMCQALRKEENNLWEDAKKYEANAVKILEDQLANHHGDAPIMAIRTPSSEVWGGAVENVV